MIKKKKLNGPKLERVTIENARLAFRNFSGKETAYNADGRRNFCVLLDEEAGENLTRLGWAVKWLQPREEGDEPQAYIKVNVSYKTTPPEVYMINSAGKTILNEDGIHVLDWVEFVNVDLIISPYNWDVNGKQGVSAYLKKMYATIAEDELAKKYANPLAAAIAHNSEDGD